MSDNLIAWELPILRYLQTLGDGLIGPLNLFTFLGTIEFYLLVLPAIYWCFDRRLGVRVGVMLMISVVLNELLKIGLHTPRPYWIDPQVRLLTRSEPTFGLPSGHAQHAVVLWGVVASGLQKGWGWVAVSILIFLIGISRVFLGVHFPSDVLVGWLTGLIILALFLRYHHSITLWVRAIRDNQFMGGIFALSLAVIGLGLILQGIVSTTWQLPPAWVELALAAAPEAPIHPLSLVNLIVSASTAFGLICGVLLLNKRGGFKAQGPWGKRLGRYGVGLSGVLILWLGLGTLFDLFAVDETGLGYVLRYVRYSLIGLWVSFLGPLLFTHLGLAEQGSV